MTLCFMNHSEKTDADLFRFSNYLVSQYFDWKYLVKFIPEMYHGHFILDIYVISVHDTFLESWNFFIIRKKDYDAVHIL
jgi:hypothetical protein